MEKEDERLENKIAMITGAARVSAGGQYSGRSAGGVPWGDVDLDRAGTIGAGTTKLRPV